MNVASKCLKSPIFSQEHLVSKYELIQLTTEWISKEPSCSQMGWYSLLEKLLSVVGLFDRNMRLGPDFFFTQYVSSILSDELF